MEAKNKTQPTYIPVCKTDMNTIIKYLDDAAKVYNHQSQNIANRAYMFRRMSRKLKKITTETCLHSMN